jgi:hypothetical protein
MIALRLLLLVTLATSASAFAQEGREAESADAEPPAASATRSDAETPAGQWPTTTMIDALVRRVSADVAHKYDLRPAQARAVEERMVERWTEFLQENRRDLQPLVNDYLETRLALDPPDADHVADWAARAMPVFSRLKQNVEATESEVRSVLDERQRADFDRTRIQRQLAMGLMDGQLKRWSVGKFRESEWWKPPAGHDRRDPGAQATRDRPDRATAANGRSLAQRTDASSLTDGATLAANDEMPPRVAEELDAWEAYVIDFCDRLDLDRSQRNAADSIFRELSGRARDHVHRHRDRITSLELRIAAGAGEDDEVLDRDLVELYGPIDRMFAELVDRLEKLPTNSQRHLAEQAATDAVAPQ